MTGNVNLVLQSFGGESEYRRAIFSLWSFYAHISSEYSGTRALLFTDNPEFFYPYLEGLPVQYVFLSAEKIRHMRGEINFLHRIKIGVIEEAFLMYEGSILYVDADTCFIKNPAPLFQDISEKISFMHVNEYSFLHLQEIPLPSGAPFHAVLKVLEEEEFTLANGSQRKFLPSLFSWNAGVIMLHRNHHPLLADVYAITDRLFPETGNHAAEQYAFSLVLQTNTELHPCNEFIYHYWYRTKKQVADKFLAKRLDYLWTQLSTEQKKRWVKNWTQALPGNIEQHPWTLRDNAIQAFNNNEFCRAYRWAAMAFIKNPFNIPFIKNCFYHTRRLLME